MLIANAKAYFASATLDEMRFLSLKILVVRFSFMVW